MLYPLYNISKEIEFTDIDKRVQCSLTQKGETQQIVGKPKIRSSHWLQF